MDDFTQLNQNAIGQYTAKDLTPRLWAELLDEHNIVHVYHIIPSNYIRDENDLKAIIDKCNRVSLSMSPFDNNIIKRFTRDQILEHITDQHTRNVILSKLDRLVNYNHFKNLTNEEMIEYIKTAEVIPSWIPPKHKTPELWNAIWDKDSTHITGNPSYYQHITPYMLDNLNYRNRILVFSHIRKIPAASISTKFLKQYYKYYPDQILYNHELITTEMVLPLVKYVRYNCYDLPMDVQIDLYHELKVTVSDEAMEMIKAQSRKKSARSCV